MTRENFYFCVAVIATLTLIVVLIAINPTLPKQRVDNRLDAGYLQSEEIKELNSKVRQMQEEMSKESNKAPPARL